MSHLHMRFKPLKLGPRAMEEPVTCCEVGESDNQDGQEMVFGSKDLVTIGDIGQSNTGSNVTADPSSSLPLVALASISSSESANSSQRWYQDVKMSSTVFARLNAGCPCLEGAKSRKKSFIMSHLHMRFKPLKLGPRVMEEPVTCCEVGESDNQGRRWVEHTPFASMDSGDITNSILSFLFGAGRARTYNFSVYPHPVSY
ncbi:hypothetical protein B0H14DRAFT_2607977 [Mycena olivaceomarginata]|nr:hypothetical protein B0H14DRAFT_2607977 [Mycena olivaceomarginata]